MNKEKIAEAISTLLYEIEGSLRSGTERTPYRVAEAYSELFEGYTTDICSLFTTFEGEGTDQVIAVRNINFSSMCEHHLMPLQG